MVKRPPPRSNVLALGAQALGAQALGAQALGAQALGAQALGAQALGAQAAAPLHEITIFRHQICHPLSGFSDLGTG